MSALTTHQQHIYIYIYDFYFSDEHKLRSKSSKLNPLSPYKMRRPKMTLQKLHKVNNMTVNHTTPVNESMCLT